MIWANARNLNLIGDALCSVPYIVYLANKRGGVSVVEGFCKDVRKLIPFSAYNVYFDQFTPEGTEVKLLDLSKVFHHCNISPIGAGLHMCQGYFAIDNEQIPELPITLPFPITSVSFTSRHIVISPFSRTDYQHNKSWLDERWVELGKRLLANNMASKIVVVGSFNDDWSVFENCGFTLFPGRPLIEVLELIRDSRLFLSVDNGVSHLAHFGGIQHHLLLQPQCLTEAFITNPRGRHIRGNPLDVTVDKMYDLAKEMLV